MGSGNISAQADDRQNEREQSPIRQQYLSVKRQYPDAILFFRMGDFYEMFDDDAELVARELELTLTRRDFGRGERSPMAGVPHHAADGYIARLIGKGYRVAVCEQVSDPALSRGLVEREVMRVVTPGTVVDPAMLAAKRNNYLAAAVAWTRRRRHRLCGHHDRRVRLRAVRRRRSGGRAGCRNWRACSQPRC